MHAGEDVGAYILIDQAILCPLRCKNRCSEKLLKMLRIEGYNLHDTQVAKDLFLMEVMDKWHNLHHFSQQDWEPLNAMIKALVFRRTRGLKR
jgi:hypothetical protein